MYIKAWRKGCHVSSSWVKSDQEHQNFHWHSRLACESWALDDLIPQKHQQNVNLVEKPGARKQCLLSRSVLAPFVYISIARKAPKLSVPWHVHLLVKAASRKAALVGVCCTAGSRFQQSLARLGHAMTAAVLAITTPLHPGCRAPRLSLYLSTSRDFLQGHIVIGQGGATLNWKRRVLD